MKQEKLRAQGLLQILFFVLVVLVYAWKVPRKIIAEFHIVKGSIYIFKCFKDKLHKSGDKTLIDFKGFYKAVSKCQQT